MERRLFHKPRRRNRIIKLTPPSVHKIPMLTGGLDQMYKNIREGCKTINLNRKKYQNEFTDDNGVFQPEVGMPLLAGRYQYKEVIGKGQSSILVKALDTFRGDIPVAIKVLHLKYAMLGNQETHCLSCLNKADPFEYSGTLRLYTTFMLMEHYCMVFEFLEPKPLHKYFIHIRETDELMNSIRKVAVHILKSLGFLQKQNIIHADLKPDNMLLKKADDLSTLKIVDFGNAIRCVHEELRLYYEDFELQTLLYRAPEVMFGVHFGLEIDMWSLGCILAELYIGAPVFYGKDKESIMQKMISILGPVPHDLFRRGKFYSELSHFTSAAPKKRAAAGLKKALGENREYNFVDFLVRLLQYDAAKRMTINEAIKHPFLAPEMPFRYFSPSETTDYDTVILDRHSYTDQPHISVDTVQLHMSSSDLLRHGTGQDPARSGSRSHSSNPAASPRKVAQVVPLIRSPTPEISDVDGVHIDLTASPAAEAFSPESPDPIYTAETDTYTTRANADTTGTAVSRPGGDKRAEHVATDASVNLEHIMQQLRRKEAKEGKNTRSSRSANIDRHEFLGANSSTNGEHSAMSSKDLGANSDCDENKNIQIKNGGSHGHHSRVPEEQPIIPRRHRKITITQSDMNSAGGYVQTEQSSNSDSGHAGSDSAVDAEMIVPGHKIRRKLARYSSSSSPPEASRTSTASTDLDSSSPAPKKLKTYSKRTSKITKAYQNDVTGHLTNSLSQEDNPVTSHVLNVTYDVVGSTPHDVTGSGKKYGRVPRIRSNDDSPETTNGRGLVKSWNRQMTSHDLPSSTLTSPRSDLSSLSRESGSLSPPRLTSPSTSSVLYDDSSRESAHKASDHMQKLDVSTPRKSVSPSSEEDVMLLLIP